MKIITGNTGTKHVTSEDDGTLYASIVGKDDYILDINDNFSHEIIDTNTIRINSGDALLNGRQVRIPKGSYDLVSIDNGQTGYKRIDLIVIRYESNKVIEKANLVVIKGASTTGNPITPEYNKESILDGALIHDVPLYKVHLNGINLEKVEKVFTARNLGVTNLGYKPNLLINGGFQVWQRGTTFTDIANEYSADRWLIKNAKGNTSLVEKSNDVPSVDGIFQSMHIRESLSENTYLQYKFEDVLKGTFTLSFWYKTSVAFNTYIYDNSTHVHLGKLEELNVWTKATFTFEAKSMEFISLIQAMSSGDTYIAGVKLEQGTFATPFVPRLYAEELMLCQRYGYLYNPADYFDMAFMFFTESLKQHNISIPFPMKMRGIPTLKVISGNVARKDNRKTNLTYLNTDMATDIANESGYKIKVSYDYDFPLNQPVEFFSFNNLKLFFDAEIY